MEWNNVMWGAGSRRGSLFVCWGSCSLRQGARRTWFSFAVKFSAVSLQTEKMFVSSSRGLVFLSQYICAWVSLITKANCIQSISIFGEDNSLFFCHVTLRFFFFLSCVSCTGVLCFTSNFSWSHKYEGKINTTNTENKKYWLDDVFLFVLKYEATDTFWHQS